MNQLPFTSDIPKIQALAKKLSKDQNYREDAFYLRGLASALDRVNGFYSGKKK